MHAAAAHEYDVAGNELVMPSLHRVAAGAGQQEDQLVKLMIMIADRGAAVVLQVEQPEILGQISPFVSVFFHI